MNWLLCGWVYQLVVFNSCQKMSLRAFYFIRALTKALTYNYINRSQCHLLVAIENNWFGGPTYIHNVKSCLKWLTFFSYFKFIHQKNHHVGLDISVNWFSTAHGSFKTLIKHLKLSWPHSVCFFWHLQS